MLPSEVVEVHVDGTRVHNVVVNSDTTAATVLESLRLGQQYGLTIESRSGSHTPVTLAGNVPVLSYPLQNGDTLVARESTAVTAGATQWDRNLEVSLQLQEIASQQFKVTEALRMAMNIDVMYVAVLLYRIT